MAIGLPVGILMGRYLPQNVLKLALGAFTLLAGLNGLWLNKGAKKTPLFLMRLCLVGGGILQGAFATGGPLVIVYAKAMIPEKQRFRATLILVWFTLNIVLLTVRWQTNQFGSVGEVIGFALAAWVAGILVGSHICRKVNAAQFEKIVYWILFCAGVFMILQSVL
jgi:Sulfite exporter TauE/SafE.